MKFKMKDNIINLDKSKENQLIDDLIKAWIAIYGNYESQFYSGEYMQEKIELILNGCMTWHSCIEENYNREHALKKIRNINLKRKIDEMK